eukprot:6978119-Prymnesium_polylepis.1
MHYTRCPTSGAYAASPSACLNREPVRRPIGLADKGIEVARSDLDEVEMADACTNSAHGAEEQPHPSAHCLSVVRVFDERTSQRTYTRKRSGFSLCCTT